MNTQITNFRDLAVEEFDTTTLLEHAAQQAIDRKYEDFLIVDVDSHHYETESIQEIAEYMDDPVMRHETRYQGMARGGITSADGSYQEIGGRITRYPGRRREKVPPSPHRDITLDAALDGRHGRRHRLHVPDADAQPRGVPAGRGRGRARHRL